MTLKRKTKADVLDNRSNLWKGTPAINSLRGPIDLIMPGKESKGAAGWENLGDIAASKNSTKRKDPKKAIEHYENARKGYNAEACGKDPVRAREGALRVMEKTGELQEAMGDSLMERAGNEAGKKKRMLREHAVDRYREAMEMYSACGYIDGVGRMHGKISEAQSAAKGRQKQVAAPKAELDVYSSDFTEKLAKFLVWRLQKMKEGE